MKTVDKPLAYEIAQFAINDGDLYRQQTTPILKNLTRKSAKGVYNHVLALKLWGYLADNAARKYAKQFSMTVANVPTRKQAASQLQDYYHEQLQEMAGGLKKNPRRKSKAPKGDLLLYRDGKFITAFSSEFEALRWFHKNHSYSMNHGLKHEGYKLYQSHPSGISTEIVRKNPSPRARQTKKYRRNLEKLYKRTWRVPSRAALDAGVGKMRRGLTDPATAARQAFTGAKRNPRGGVRIVHNKLLGGWFIVRGPHQTPIGGRFNSKAEAQAHLARRNPMKKKRTFSRKQLAAQKRFGKMAKMRAKLRRNPTDRYGKYRKGLTIKGREYRHYGSGAGPFTTRSVKKRRTKPIKKNPRGFDCMLSTTRHGKKFWYTGRTLDSNKSAGIRMSEKTARETAARIANKTGYPIVVESC